MEASGRVRSLRLPQNDSPSITRSLLASFDSRARVEVVAQGVTNEVEAQHGQHYGQRGKQHEMGRVEQMGATVVEHSSPTGGGRRNTESEKTHRRFGEDCSRHADGSLHDDRLNYIRQNVAEDDAQIAGAQGAGGFDEFALAGG